MPKTKPRVTKTQQKAISSYVKKGYSANKIQKSLSKRGIGIRRQVLLRHIRATKRRITPPTERRYVPIPERRVGRRKYVPKPKPIFQKGIKISGKDKLGRKVVQTYFGSGGELYRIVKKEFDLYAEGKAWSTKPKVESV